MYQGVESIASVSSWRPLRRVHLQTLPKSVCPGCASQYNCPDCGTKLDDAGLKALLDLAIAKEAAARGEAPVEVLALVLVSFSGERALAIRLFDAITTSDEPPPYPFDLRFVNIWAFRDNQYLGLTK